MNKILCYICNRDFYEWNTFSWVTQDWQAVNTWWGCHIWDALVYMHVFFTSGFDLLYVYWKNNLWDVVSRCYGIIKFLTCIIIVLTRHPCFRLAEGCTILEKKEPENLKGSFACSSSIIWPCPHKKYALVLLKLFTADFSPAAVLLTSSISLHVYINTALCNSAYTVKFNIA